MSVIMGIGVFTGAWVGTAVLMPSAHAGRPCVATPLPVGRGSPLPPRPPFALAEQPTECPFRNPSLCRGAFRLGAQIGLGPALGPALRVVVCAMGVGGEGFPVPRAGVSSTSTRLRTSATPSRLAGEGVVWSHGRAHDAARYLRRSNECFS